MDIIKIKEYIENQFVEDYEEIKKFMDDVNETLINIKINETYETYNEFCIDIERSVVEIIETKNIKELTPQIIITALNDMIKYKILNDPDYEEKIRDYFDDPELVIDDINKLKIKNLNIF